MSANIVSIVAETLVALGLKKLALIGYRVLQWEGIRLLFEVFHARSARLQ